MRVDLTGTHYDMGYQHGVKLGQYRLALLGLIGEHHEMLRTLPPGAVDETVSEVEEVLRRHSPQTLDMIRGMADGFKLLPRDLLALRLRGYVEDRFSLRSEIHEQERGCTAWAISGKDVVRDGVLIAKNRDFLMSNRELQALFRCRPRRGYEYISLHTFGACNVPSCGMNSKGLAIVDTRVPSSDVGPGIPRFTLMMHVLEDLQSAEEVTDYLRSVPRMGGGNFVFADARGHIGKAEIGYQNIEITQTNSGHVICTNHFESPSLKPEYRRRGEEKERESQWRSDKVTELLSGVRVHVDFSFAAGVMSVHGDRYAICRHGTPKASDKSATISCIIFVPERREFYYCQGFPCMVPFQRMSFS